MPKFTQEHPIEPLDPKPEHPEPKPEPKPEDKVKESLTTTIDMGHPS